MPMPKKHYTNEYKYKGVIFSYILKDNEAIIIMENRMWFTPFLRFLFPYKLYKPVTCGAYCLINK